MQLRLEMISNLVEGHKKKPCKKWKTSFIVFRQCDASFIYFKKEHTNGVKKMTAGKKKCD